MVVINKIKFIILILLLSFLTSNTNASRILDYETEIFIDNIINEIKKINNINKDFNFVIISDDNINDINPHIIIGTESEDEPNNPKPNGCSMII